MARVFITGSTDGLGLAATELLVSQRHQVVGHARRWPAVLSNAFEPGWVPTKMGGAGAPDDLSQAHVTQAWLAVSDSPQATVSGQYFYHQKPRATHPAVRSAEFQDALVEALVELTGVTLPSA